jgi:hypothetical protein
VFVLRCAVLCCAVDRQGVCARACRCAADCDARRCDARRAGDRAAPRRRGVPLQRHAARDGGRAEQHAAEHRGVGVAGRLGPSPQWWRDAAGHGHSVPLCAAARALRLRAARHDQRGEELPAGASHLHAHVDADRWRGAAVASVAARCGDHGGLQLDKGGRAVQCRCCRRCRVALAVRTMHVRR